MIILFFYDENHNLVDMDLKLCSFSVKGPELEMEILMLLTA